MEPNDPYEPPDSYAANEENNLAPPLNNHRALLTYLYAHGHFHQRDKQNFRIEPKTWQSVVELPVQHADVVTAVRSWQCMRPALAEDGVFGPKCHAQAATETGARCGLPDIMQRSHRTTKWPDDCKHHLTTHHTLDRLSYLADTGQTINQAWHHGLDLWNQAADITLTTSTGRAEVRIRAEAQHLGRNILAWSELAGASCNATLDQAYNNNVQWNWHLLWSTICHEIGHALGLGHGGRGIMQPAHDPSVGGLGTWDVRQITDRYGPATAPPKPPVPEDVAVHHATLELFSEEGLSLARFDIKPAE